MFQMTTDPLANPWAVESVKDLTFICCPECVFKSKDESIFEEHAVRNHPRSESLFVKNKSNEDMKFNEIVIEESIKLEEPDEEFETKDCSIQLSPIRESVTQEYENKSREKEINEINQKVTKEDDMKECDICHIIFTCHICQLT